MKAFYTLAICLIVCASIFADPSEAKAKDIVKKCIKRHGGERKFKKVRNIYAEMSVRSFSEKGDIESIFREYYRRPDKLRMEIQPLLEEPTIISWDGKKAWHLIKNKLEESDDPKIVERLQEGLKFLRLMLLTNLFEKGSRLSYVTYFEKQKIHVISRTIDGKKEDRIRLFIRSDYVLVGADFFWTGTQDLLVVRFRDHSKMAGGLYLPVTTELSKKPHGQKKVLVMRATLKKIRINALRNGNSFFTNLKEKPRMKKRRGG